ncbi:hypothetical protein BGW36DRAFT_364395 [Talaromyces proteolyticus]|uniref:Uncharacterized protein n=1 Tax=Talaromyces proteolyticus TaxID=1131652 RepID=A0AAD4KJR6_9EURO|nr:uncharacterized protein BGW36DRAFT_364395 [Talaromyces proteolyticus]KAH8690842.1 hypothetical protein BGW36DRAFT_364395 [Talaromyces proteolyticus]
MCLLKAFIIKKYLKFDNSNSTRLSALHRHQIFNLKTHSPSITVMHPPNWKIFSILFAALAPVHLIIACLSPLDIANAVNSLATETFSLKDYVASVVASHKATGILSIYRQFDEIYDHTLSDIGFTSGCIVLVNNTDQQVVYEAYSNVIFALK